MMGDYDTNIWKYDNYLCLIVFVFSFEMGIILIMYSWFEL